MEKIICPQCGNEIKPREGLKFCTHCGFEIEKMIAEESKGIEEHDNPVSVENHSRHQEFAQSPGPNPPKKTNTALIIVAVLGGLILLGGLLFLGIRFLGNRSENTTGQEQTSGQEQTETYTEVLQLPSFSLNGGTYTGQQSVVINKPEGQNITIYYTTDGSDPNQNSQKYEGPIAISKDTTLKCIAIDQNGNRSGIKTAVYQITALQQPQQTQQQTEVTPQQPTMTAAEAEAIERAQFEDNIRGTWVYDDGSGYLIYYDFYDGYFYAGDGGDGYEGYYTFTIEPGNNGTIGTVYAVGEVMYIDCNPMGDNAIYINGYYLTYYTY